MKYEKPLLMHIIKWLSPRKIGHHTTRSQQHQQHAPRQSFPAEPVRKGYSEREIVRAHGGYYACYDVIGRGVCAYATSLRKRILVRLELR